jgi:ATP synthase protein I
VISTPIPNETLGETLSAPASTTPGRSKDRPSPFFEAAGVASVGVEMAVATGIGWGIGYWLDGKFGTGPWLMLVGLLFGVAAGFNGLIRTAKSTSAAAPMLRKAPQQEAPLQRQGALMDPKALERIEKLNYFFGAALILVTAVLTEQYFALGVTTGVALTCINFTLIRRLVTKLLASAPEKRAGTAFFFVPKMSGLLVLVALAVYFLPISAIGIGIGFSVFLLSIMVESVRFMSGAALIR